MKIFEKKIQDKSILNKRKPQESGFVMLTVVVIFLFISLGAALSIAAVVYRQHQIVNNGVRSAQSLYASESLQDDIFYRFTTGKDVSPNETLELNGAVANATIEDISDGKRSTSIGDAENRIRKTEMVVNEGSGASFFYGVQSGRGGFTLQNNAEVIGNIYSNGTVEGAGNNVEGDVVSATDSGLISGITTNYSAYAHRIEDSDIGQDAYYQSIFNTSVGGNEYPGSDDLPEIDLPISDEQIEDWEEGAESGGVISSPCPLSSR
ncbi:MAG: hypothetical protein U5L75_03495 [Candidatus Campbellbacteria bacterium]|nr:hypothetical protein [Candidatus Campbellbacteria bacterium]